MRYLDPKNDLTFKKVFGQHPNLVKSLLNALMPLHPDQRIETVEYLPTELVPQIPGLKDSIVDVRCEDNRGRQFIVEMQLIWTPSFRSRVLFNASKAFVKQLERGKRYESLQPVYALSLVDAIFEKESEEFYHHYSIVNNYDTKQRMEGLEFVFIELPKFKPDKMRDKRMAVLWLRFLTEIKDGMETLPAGLSGEADLQHALDILQESAFTKVELDYYDRLWDSVMKERMIIEERTRLAREEALKEGEKKGREEGEKKGREEGERKGREEGERKGREEGERKGREEGERKGREEGEKKGREEGEKKGREEGKKEEKIEAAIAGLKENVPVEIISKMTGLTAEEIEKIKLNIEI